MIAKPILDPAYWKKRLEDCRELHHSVYVCTNDQWREIEQRHTQEIAAVLNPYDHVLDLGCAYGRLLNMLPETWLGDYVGVDLSPDFIELAKHIHPHRTFVVSEFSEFLDSCPDKAFDIAILISIKGMTISQVGELAWNSIESRLNRVCKKQLILEYT